MISRRRGSHRRAGISLFEILVTVAVLAILAAIVMPAFRSMEAQSLESLARLVAADLRLARNQAIQHNTEYSVQFNIGNNSYQIVHTGTGTPPPLRNPSAGGGTVDGDYTVELSRFGPTRNQSSSVRLVGVATADTNTAKTDVTFGPIGGTGPARSEDTVIWLSYGSGAEARSVRLTVSWITGQVWIEPVSSGG